MNISENCVVYSKNSPFEAILSAKEPLSKKNSSKETYHLVLNIRNSGIKYKPGDSVAIFPKNNPALVELIISALKASGEEPIVDPKLGVVYTLKEFLSTRANLSRLTSSFLKVLYAHQLEGEASEKLQRLLAVENKEDLKIFLQQQHPIDALKEFGGADLPLQEICSQFGPLLPRFYSISSSQSTHPDEIHLTVALYTFSAGDEKKFGVASHFLCHLAKIEETRIPIYIQPTVHFTLPDDTNAPIIMIGPGTGIAPFRAFLQERSSTQSPGENWLFFGERNKSTDYFYENYFESLSEAGKLRVDLAFSRDQEKKIYVQHKMWERKEELWCWLKKGAYLFVCGDAQRMAKDVEQTLLLISQEEGNLTEQEAKNFLKALKSEKKYRTDVY
ncbi:MAG: sulfite reductase [Chlamydiae bacterium]|nr:sulfite reductase [Chlamydiota bacterium]